jgi:hypothetical protein
MKLVRLKDEIGYMDYSVLDSEYISLPKNLENICKVYKSFDNIVFDMFISFI